MYNNCEIRRYTYRGVERIVLRVRQGYDVNVMEPMTVRYGKGYGLNQLSCNCQSCEAKRHREERVRSRVSSSGQPVATIQARE